MSVIKFTKVLLAAAMLFAISFNAHAADAALKPDAKPTDNPCKPEANASGCEDLVAGKGLLKCMSSYKMANRDFKFSEGCSEAMKQMRKDSTAGK